METIVYLMRHSKTVKVNYLINNDSLLIQNQKSILSCEGEEIAKKHSMLSEFEKIDLVISSNYVRAISTAKYIAQRNNIEINIIDDFGERIHGVNSYSELPKDFEKMQFNDENFKVGSGESQIEVRNRMYEALKKVIHNNCGKNILITSHSTAISFLLKKWCDVEYGGPIKYNKKIVFDGDWSFGCETFRLVFDSNDNLLSIKFMR